MKKVNIEAVYKTRYILCNPYAHMEYIGEESFSSELQSKHTPIDGDIETSTEKLSKTKYETQSSNVSKKNTDQFFLKPRYEREARNVHRKLWRERHEIWGGRTNKDPISLLEPQIVLHRLGYSVEFVEGYAPEIKNGKTIKVAGELDCSKKKVFISRQFPIEQQRFTAAHELGHIILHEKSVGLHHRDRSFDGVNISHETIEKEADKFAVHFLMPENLIRALFEKRFNVFKFHISPESAGALGFPSVSHLKKTVKSKRALSRLLASSKDYAGKYFKSSLAFDLKVSVESLAIRLEELKLVEF